MPKLKESDMNELTGRLRTMQALEHDAEAVLEAADEIERQGNAIKSYEAQANTDAINILRLKAELAEKEGVRVVNRNAIQLLKEKLASAKEDVAMMREALASANQEIVFEGVRYTLLGIEEREEALALPADRTALDAALLQARREGMLEAADICGEFYHTDLAKRAIRQAAERSGE